MQKPKGVIMQVSGSYAIVMTPDRQFLRVPLQAGMTIGQEVEVGNARTHFSWRKMGLIAASLALALGLWQSRGLFVPDRAMAYVALDINPSLELSIDKDKEVIEVTAYNQDAENLVNRLKLKGKAVDRAIQDITAEAAKLGYIKPEGEILVTASDAGTAEMDLNALEQEVIRSVQDYLQQSGIKTNVGGVLVSEQEREAAKTMGLSPGKYALYKQAEARNLQISVEDLKQQSVSNLANEHGQAVKELVQNMNGSKKLEDLLEELNEKEKHKEAADKEKDKDQDKQEKQEKQTNKGADPKPKEGKDKASGQPDPNRPQNDGDKKEKDRAQDKDSDKNKSDGHDSRQSNEQFKFNQQEDRESDD